MGSYYVYTQSISVGYDGKPLIENIKIGVCKGEILTLIGPNGSGKSTILKSIIGQLKLISGTVVLDGKPMSEMTERDIAKKLSIVMTERIRPELMTCREIVESGRYPYTGRLGVLSQHDKETAENAIKTVHAEDYADKLFSQISDGQRQRLMLARAICQEPDCIVLDEPTSFLDVKHKIELLGILKSLVREKNIAVIMSLHELDLAEKVSDCVVCVKDRQILCCDIPERVFRDDFIRSLYDIKNGSYNSLFGCVEMQKAEGVPHVFVIGGAGTGIPVYRMLQRKSIPFAAGVLFRNDLDFPVADALATEVVSEPPYSVITDKSMDSAKRIIGCCKACICTIDTFGQQIEANRELREFAESAGLLTEAYDLLKKLGVKYD